jgi:hypothetical protein
MKGKVAGANSAARRDAAAEPGPELPSTKAFVLQLTRATGPTLEPFAGRVEHLSTGRRTRFETVEEFLTALRHLLIQTKSG